MSSSDYRKYSINSVSAGIGAISFNVLRAHLSPYVGTGKTSIPGGGCGGVRATARDRNST